MNHRAANPTSPVHQPLDVFGDQGRVNVTASSISDFPAHQHRKLTAGTPR